MSVLRANIAELMAVDLDHILFEELGTYEYEALLNSIYSVETSKKKLEYGSKEVNKTLYGFG